jgi:hypothetical protein
MRARNRAFAIFPAPIISHWSQTLKKLEDYIALKNIVGFLLFINPLNTCLLTSTEGLLAEYGTRMNQDKRHQCTERLNGGTYFPYMNKRSMAAAELSVMEGCMRCIISLFQTVEATKNSWFFAHANKIFQVFFLLLRNKYKIFSKFSGPIPDITNKPFHP